MPRNIDGLKRSARLLSESATHRALAALQRMDVSDREINFRAVATDARVSTAWLYSQEGLRIRIMQSRKRQSQLVPPSALQDRERLSRQNIVTTLRVKIKTLEEKNRELTGILEVV
jgi:acetaldehyde dehydrogenase (acetylating)